MYIGLTEQIVLMELGYTDCFSTMGRKIQTDNFNVSVPQKGIRTQVSIWILQSTLL